MTTINEKPKSPLLRDDVPVYFRESGVTPKEQAVRFKHNPLGIYTKKEPDGKEYKVTRESNELMDALLGGEVITREEYNR